MGCPSGYSDIASYTRYEAVALYLGDVDGSPCREAYMGSLESFWAEFKVSLGECPTAPGRPKCVLTSCANAKYAAYLASCNTATTTYQSCVVSA